VFMKIKDAFLPVLFFILALLFLYFKVFPFTSMSILGISYLILPYLIIFGILSYYKYKKKMNILIFILAYLLIIVFISLIIYE